MQSTEQSVTDSDKRNDKGEDVSRSERATLPPRDSPAYEDEVVELARNGFCLWLGAGVSLQLSSGTNVKVPLWSKLVEQLESEIDLDKTSTDCLSLPERLNLVLGNLGRHDFQRRLRMMLAVPVAKAAICHLEKWIEDGEIPQILDQLALFGALSTSVVSFNVESVSSRLVAAASPYALKVFHPPMEGTSGFRHWQGKHDRRATGEVPLGILHPHGAVDIGGRCVMTSEEYRALNGTLGLELAVHSCFGDNILILGMSLEDEYLRRQLVMFRGQIRSIYWIRIEGGRDESDAWAAANGIRVMRFSNYSEIWNMFTRYRKGGPGAVMHLPWHEPTRRGRIARRMTKEVMSFMELASDLSVETVRALSELKTADPDDIRMCGARLVRGADLGEDPKQPGKLSSPQEQRVKEISRGLAAWAEKHDPSDP